VELIGLLQEARERTLGLLADLADDQLFGPHLDIINPLLWEIGHVAWFQEKWSLRHLRGAPPLLEQADALYDSFAVAHDTRWDLPLINRQDTLAYMQQVLKRVVDSLAKTQELSQEEFYFHWLPLLHEDMHCEAFAYTRQTLEYPAPLPEVYGPKSASPGDGESLPGDVEFAGGSFLLGAPKDLPFVFDNEKWAHPVDIAPFAMARAAVSQGEFRAFVEDSGYSREKCWSTSGWQWRLDFNVQGPLYWRREGKNFSRRIFDSWVPLEEHQAMVHVGWYEAEAYCRWAGRRLPTDA
jgi:iron(II)-dependent oxidoreductase